MGETAPKMYIFRGQAYTHDVRTGGEGVGKYLKPADRKYIYMMRVKGGVGQKIQTPCERHIICELQHKESPAQVDPQSVICLTLQGPGDGVLRAGGHHGAGGGRRHRDPLRHSEGL